LINRYHTLVKLHERIELTFAELASEIECYSQRLTILVILNQTVLQVNLSSNNVTFMEHFLVWDVSIVKSWKLALVCLAVKQIENIKLFLLVLDNGVLVEVKIVSAEAKAHLYARVNNRSTSWHRWRCLLIKICLYFELEVVRVFLVFVVDQWKVTHGFTSRVAILMIG